MISYAKYPIVKQGWPKSGRHILATYNEEHVVVYQAYKPSIGRWAAKNGQFGGDFSFSRMSWIKPNFLWMMYRSGWGSKEGQEVTLAVTIPRTLFDHFLAVCVFSSFGASGMKGEIEWKRKVASSDVRLQWDPDHDPSGARLQRRALQLGLRGGELLRYASQEVVQIDDISELVRDGYEKVTSGCLDELMVPQERVYIPASRQAVDNIRLEATH